MHKRYIPEFSDVSPTSSIQKTKEDQKSDIENTLKLSISRQFNKTMRRDPSASQFENDYDEKPEPQKPKSFGGLTTLPNFYHKELNVLL